MKKVLTLHLDGKNLTPQLVAILGTIAEELVHPELKVTQAGITVSIDRWSSRA